MEVSRENPDSLPVALPLTLETAARGLPEMDRKVCGRGRRAVNRTRCSRRQNRCDRKATDVSSHTDWHLDVRFEAVGHVDDIDGDERHHVPVGKLNGCLSIDLLE